MFPSSIKREIRTFYVVDVQRRQRNLLKRGMHVQSLTLLRFFRPRFRFRRLLPESFSSRHIYPTLRWLSGDSPVTLRWLSTLEIGAAQLRPATEIAPKSPFLLGIRAGAKAIRCQRVNIRDLTKPRRRRRQRERKKTIGLMSKTTTRASRFFVHFFAFTAQLRREMTQF